MRLAQHAALLAALAIAVTAAPAAAAPLPKDFFGVSSPELIRLSPEERVPVFADQQAAGVRVIRQLFDWSAIEATKGSYSWESTDSFMASAARADMEVLPVVLYSPTWASSCPSYSAPRQCPPANNADYGAFLVTLIERYGPNGSFWQSNSSVPKRPITAWQIWNEPNFPSFWGTPDAAAYARMLIAVAPLIRAADPHAEIVSAGMPDSLVSTATRLIPYVNALYANGAKGSFDTLALHIYDDTPDLAVGLVEQVRAIMNANGDNAVPIWVTEWGWASSGFPSRFTTDLAGQAANVDALMGKLVARHEELGVRGLVEYLWHDGSPQSNTGDGWPNHLGIVFQDYTHKPSYDAFQARAIHTEPPDTTLDAGPSGTVVPGPQSFAFSSTEPGSDFECRLDGSPWSACTSPYAVPVLALGGHTFTVRAIDPYGNADRSPIEAGWVVAVPTPPPPVFDPADVRRDALAQVGRLRRLGLRKLARRHEVVLSANWPGAGSVTLALKAGRKTIAAGSLRLAGAGHGLVHVKLSSSGRKLLARSRRVRLALVETFTPNAGSSGPLTATAAMTLRR